MAARQRVDVLVVGARCAGAAAAMMMARRGLSVLAVDRGAYGADALSTHALMRGAVMQLARWGVLDRIIAAGTPPVRQGTFTYGEDAVAIPVKPGHGIDALYAPRRTVLDRILVDAARQAGAEVCHGWSATQLVRRPDGRVAGAVLLDPSGAPVEVDCGLVVGADGIASTVARLAGAEVLATGEHAAAVLYGYWEGLAVDGFTQHYRPGAAVGAIPTNAGQALVFVMVPAARFRDELRHDVQAGFCRVLAETAPGIAGAIAGAPPAAPLSVFAGRKGFLRQPCGAGWALIGDAGYFKDPITAHGITDALRDAELLAEAAVEGTASAFAGYAATRARLAAPLFAATEAIASFKWDLDTLRAHHQGLNAAMKAEVEWLAARAPAAPAMPHRRLPAAGPQVLIQPHAA